MFDLGPNWQATGQKYTKYICFIVFIAFFDEYRGKMLDLPAIASIAVDSMVHSSVSLYAWYVTSEVLVRHMHEDIGMTRREEGLTAYLIAAAVDVDHFIAAGSLTLHDATNLQTRQWCLFHNPLACIVLATLSHCYGLRPRLAALLIIGMGTHILRDAQRTGILLYPWGVTPAIPIPLVAFVLAIVPYVMSLYLKRAFASKSIPHTLHGENELLL
jgi:hypothetical protein